jgi:hypothetical protein
LHLIAVALLYRLVAQIASLVILVVMYRDIMALIEERIYLSK